MGFEEGCTAALALGIYGVLTVMMGLCGFLEPRQTGNLSRVRGLNLFSVLLGINRKHLSLLYFRGFLSEFNHTRGSTVLLTITIGTAIWFWTLRERSEYAKMWDASETKMKEYLQDHVRFFLPYESDSYYTDSWSLRSHSSSVAVIGIRRRFLRIRPI